MFNLRPHWREDLAPTVTTSPVKLLPAINFLYLDIIILDFISRKDHTKNKKKTVIFQSATIVADVFCYLHNWWKPTVEWITNYPINGSDSSAFFLYDVKPVGGSHTSLKVVLYNIYFGIQWHSFGENYVLRYVCFQLLV